ncbi:MAG TPA: hypothetical protein VGW38_01595, partial [Chloroflexota bacterium]|nr:hypothetical protein [Chloroflexota bacterium]
MLENSHAEYEVHGDIAEAVSVLDDVDLAGRDLVLQCDLEGRRASEARRRGTRQLRHNRGGRWAA